MQLIYLIYVKNMYNILLTIQPAFIKEKTLYIMFWYRDFLAR